MTGNAVARPAWSHDSAWLRLPPGVRSDAASWGFERATGRGVRVAVIDSGVEAAHPWLDGAVDEEASVAFTVDREGNLQKTVGPHIDVYGHGTACAGIIHALAPEAEIVSVRVLDEAVRGSAAAFHAGLTWAVEQEIDVINLSIGASKPDWALAFHEVCDRGYFNHSFIVTAANNLPRESFPSLFASVASVAANTSDDPMRYHVNPSPPTEFLARGIDVEVPWVGGTTTISTGNSLAAPHIAAFAALIKSEHPELRPFQVKTALWAAAANVREAGSAESPASLEPIAAGRLPAATRSIRATLPLTGGRAPAPPTPPAPPASPAPPDPTQAGPPRPTVDRRTRQGTGLLAGFELGETIDRFPGGHRLEAWSDGQALVLTVIDRPEPEPALPGNGDAVIDLRTGSGTKQGTDAVTAVRRAAAIDHPHLAPVLQLRSDDRSIVLAGPRHRPLDVRQPGGCSPEAAVAVALSLLDALHTAHGCGLVHGAIRPALITVDTHRRIQLEGLPVAASRRQDPPGPIDLDDPAGWPYLSPALLHGAPPSVATDLHAVSVLWFELLTGDHPTPAPASLGQLVAQGARPRPRPARSVRPDLPGPLAELVDRLLDPRPGDELRSALGLSAAVEQAATATFGGSWEREHPFRLELCHLRAFDRHV